MVAVRRDGQHSLNMRRTGLARANGRGTASRRKSIGIQTAIANEILARASKPIQVAASMRSSREGRLSGQPESEISAAPTISDTAQSVAQARKRTNTALDIRLV